MVTNQKSTGRASSLWAGLAFGGAVSTGITLVITAVLAKLLDLEKLQWENIGYGILIMIITSSFMGAIVAFGKIKRQRMVVCMLSGVVYLGIMLTVTALFFGGQFEAVGVTVLLIAAGCGSAGLLGLREKRGGNRRKGKRYYR